MTYKPERDREYQREYRAKNRERKNAQQRASYARNREKRLETARAWRVRNREADLQKQAAWRAANPNYQRDWYQRNRARVSAYGIARRHGMRPEEWQALWAAQEGRCYLCGDELDPKYIVIDHNHSCCPTMQSCRICRRGLACKKCNSAIGLANDSPERLRRLADALEAADAIFAQRKAANDAAQTPLFR